MIRTEFTERCDDIMAHKVLLIWAVVTFFETWNADGCGDLLEPRRQTSSCPDLLGGRNCTCTTLSLGNELVNCSGAGLTGIPPDLPNLHMLLARGSDMTSLGQIPLYPKLHTLDLANSNIEHLSSDVFINITQLKRLVLRDNPLMMSQIPSDLFKPLVGLEYLDMSGHLAKRILEKKDYDLQKWLNTTYRDDIFVYLKNLNTLILDGLPYFNVPGFLALSGKFGDGFRKLTSLKELEIRGFFPKITNNTFSAFENISLRSLSIQSCWLSDIDSYAFEHFHELEVLDLSYNPTLNLTSVPKSWPGLKYTKIKRLYLSRITDFLENIYTISESFFVGLENTNITYIDLEGNHIVAIEPVFNKYLPNIENITLAYNRMEPLTAVHDIIDDFSKLERLKHLDISNQFRRIYVSPFETLIRFVPNPIQYFERLAHFFDRHASETQRATRKRLRRGGDERRPRPIGYPKPVPLTIPKSLVYLDLSQSLALTVPQMPALDISNGHNLKYLYYRDNGIITLDNRIMFMEGPPINASFDISDNGCLVLALNKIFVHSQAPNTLISVVAKHNKLGEYLAKHGKSSFHKFSAIEEVDLEDNLIRELSHDIFEGQINMKKLSLKTNAIRHFNTDIKHMKRLEELDLSNNLLSTLSEKHRTILSNLATNEHKIYVYLSGNPLACDCGNLGFLKWVLEECSNGNVVFIDMESYQCSFEGNPSVKWEEQTLQQIIDSLGLTCKSTLYITIGTVLAVVIIFAVLLSIVIRRHRWDIRFWFVNLVLKRKAERQLEAETRSITHDAFVAYHVNDVSWVKNELLPNTEELEDSRLHLILHHRDFMPGAAIQENIVSSIKHSRRTLLVVTRDFLRSNWCQFEVQMARVESFDHGRDIIVAILLEPVSVLMADPEMSQVVQNILRKRTYIEWPTTVEDRDHFWTKVRETIKKPGSCQMVCECGRETSTRLMLNRNSENGSSNTGVQADFETTFDI